MNKKKSLMPLTVFWCKNTNVHMNKIMIFPSGVVIYTDSLRHGTGQCVLPN